MCWYHLLSLMNASLLHGLWVSILFCAYYCFLLIAISSGSYHGSRDNKPLEKLCHSPQYSYWLNSLNVWIVLIFDYISHSSILFKKISGLFPSSPIMMGIVLHIDMFLTLILAKCNFSFFNSYNFKHNNVDFLTNFPFFAGDD